jgi:hypothetical protein
MKIKAGTTYQGKQFKAEVEREVGTNLDAAIAQIGRDAVFKHYLAGVKLPIQAAFRSVIGSGGSLEQAKQAMLKVDLQTGRMPVIQSAADAMVLIGDLAKKHSLDPVQIGNLVLWSTAVPNRSTESIEKAAELLAAGFELE